MFYVPKDAIYKKVGRRDFLKMGGGAATALGAGSIALGLNSVINVDLHMHSLPTQQNGSNMRVQNLFS
jgi:anaerobic selenocysteine-containing dehydrogenase